MPSFQVDETKYCLPTQPLRCHQKTNVTAEGPMPSHEPSSPPIPVVEGYPSNLSQRRQKAVAILLILANFVPMISFGAGMGGGLHIASSLGVTELSQASWIAASYPLTAGAFILMSGRVGSIYGHARVLLLGAAWWIIWSLISGFCDNFIAFNIARGMSGVGGAMVVPNAVAIIGTTFPPGSMRNRCLGLFGAGAPVGGWAGMFLLLLDSSLIGQEHLFEGVIILGGFKQSLDKKLLTLKFCRGIDGWTFG